MEISRLTRDGRAEPVSRDHILRHVRGQGNIHFPCSADHEQDWQPYPVDPYSAICDDHTIPYINSKLIVMSRELLNNYVSQHYPCTPNIFATCHILILERNLRRRVISAPVIGQTSI